MLWKKSSVEMTTNRRHLWLVGLVLMLTACVPVAPPAAPTAVGQAPVETVPPEATVGLPPTWTPTPTATASPTPTPGPTPAPRDLHLSATGIRVHPQPFVVAGDRVSFEVLVEGESAAVRNIRVRLYEGVVDDPTDAVLAEVVSESFGLGRRRQATFYFVYTAPGIPGAYTFTAWLDPLDEVQQGDDDPDNNRVVFTVDVLPRSALPANEDGALWLTARSVCCTVFYTRESAADRDLLDILNTLDASSAAMAAEMGLAGVPPVTVNLVNRVVGHGGFASGDVISISYLDRHYAGSNFESVVRHELVHVYDLTYGRYRPPLMAEGLAVLLAGGHYKFEDVQARARGLQALGWLLPMAELADDFYGTQHEIGYLQAASWVGYLREQYGMDGIWALYAAFDREIALGPGGHRAALEVGLQRGLGITLAESERAWLAWLAAQPLDVTAQRDIEVTVYLYDTVRLYQQVHEPAAYFLTAWLPDIRFMQQQQIVADYTRRPGDVDRVGLELALTAADAALQGGEFDRAVAYLDSVNVAVGGPLRQLSVSEAETLGGVFRAVVFAVGADGLEPQVVALSEDLQSAEVLAVRVWPTVERWVYQRAGAGWAAVEQVTGQ